MLVKYLLQTAVLCAFAFGENIKSTEVQQSGVSYRLTNTTEPISYELWLETKIHERILDYNGRVRITLRALEATKTITIHSEKLLLTNHTLFDHLNNVLPILHVVKHEEETILEVLLEESLKIDQTYILDIEFQGVLQSIPQGFCYTRYIDENGETLYMATSNLHVTNARMGFPCYDEPRYRTPFLIHITHHATMKAASNMPVDFITNNTDGSAMTTFQNSVSMSVNLLAVAVCKHETYKMYLEDKNVEIVFLVPNATTDEINFAKDFITFILEKLEEYLDVGYNLPKLECVVVDDGMHIGLENWGLMVFDSKSFYYKEGQTTPSQKMDIAKVICHQLSHNNFGNLVGISWWNYAWMTEGFANYQEYYFTNMYLTDYPMHDLFVAEFIQRNLAEHSYLMSNSLNKYVQTRREVEEAYDYGMASKAAAVLRMCDHTIERTTFQKGLQRYIKEMAFRVAEPKDLYSSIQEAVSEDKTLPEDIRIEDFLNSWVEQPGFPLLTATRNYQSNEIVVNQQRFLASRDEIDVDGLSWYIPLSMSTANNPDMENTRPRAWLTKGTRELVLQTAENNSWTSEDWILFNIQQTGYYRVNYDTDNWKLLADELHRGQPYKIGKFNRAQLIDDSFSLAYSDIIPFTVALDIIKYIKYDEEYAVWVTANRHLLNMIRKLDGPSYELFFGRFLRHLTEDQFEKLDVFENIHGKDSVKDIFLRPIIVDLACRSRSGMCLTATRIMVTAEALTGHCLAPNEKPSIYYCHGLKNADEKTFQYFWKKLKTLTNHQEKTHIAYSISCYHNPESIYSLLLELCDSNFHEVMYSNLERFQILITAVRNGHVKTVLKFLRENHQEIAQTFTYNIRMEQSLKEIADCLDGEDEEEFEGLLQILIAAGHINSNLAERCMIDMKYHRKWVNENKIGIEDWIGDYFQPAMESSAIAKLFYLPVLLLSSVQAVYSII